VQARWLKRLAAIALPEGVLLVATAVYLRLDALQDTQPELAQFYPYAVFAVGGLLAWRFHRARLLFALAALALATVAIRTHGAAGTVLFRATTLLLPVNLAVLALLADRGVLTRIGLVQIGAIALQVILVVLFSRSHPTATAALLGHPLLPATLFKWSALGQPALLAFVIAVGFTTAPLLFEPNATGRGFLWAILASLLAVTARRLSPAPAIYLGTAGLILVVSVIEASYLLAYYDGLTTLPARRALTEALQRLAGQYTIAMIDIDHFKKFNDEYGHDVGDQVLRMVAARLAKVTGGGRAYRYGGEEFAILFSGKTVAETLEHLEAVRKAVGGTAFTIRRRIRRKRSDAKTRRRGTQVSITISIGVADKNSRHGTPEQVLRAADQALYRAKEDGRNRVRS
jgi:diguanylate cyclase (GGDEF)-like protein